MTRIKSFVSELVRKSKTSDPYEIARLNDIHIQQGSLGQIKGFYLKLFDHQFIYINSDEDYHMRTIIAAHELGHALLTPDSYYFFPSGDTLYRDRAEIQAHTFAAELLIPDEIILENPGYTHKQLAILTGYTERLLKFKTL